MQGDLKNLIITILLSTAILLGWQYFYEQPRIEQSYKIAQEASKKDSSANEVLAEVLDTGRVFVDRNIALTKSGAGRVRIASTHLTGSISLQGVRLDDLTLNGYKKSIDEDSNEVILFAPSNTKEAYFAEFGWISPIKDFDLPDSKSVWVASKQELTDNDSIDFYWKNKQGVKFIITISLDSKYMFTVTQTIRNHSNDIVSVYPYGLINRNYEDAEKANLVIHQGALGVFNEKLEEMKYADLVEEKHKKYTSKKGGWIGITDKYWLSAIIPQNQGKFDANFSGYAKGGTNKYQVDYVGEKVILTPNKEVSFVSNLFAGAKKVNVLDQYKEQYGAVLFDRAVDFGWFYFLTKPMFRLLEYFYGIIGNFGLAILLMTIAIRILLFPLANKSYRSMNKIKKLQPELTKLKERFGSDRVRMNNEMMELYRRESVNPLSGCLPMIVQLPVFFSLYKVIFVSLEMRHAPFFGWIRDLSAADPTSIVNLFGIIPWDPPSFLTIGAWPIIMGVSMFLQQRMSPEPSDPVQAKVMKFLPLFIIFMFHSFPAGLMIYWSWSNILSIVQQWLLLKTEKVKKNG
jgi:YidC/Oxa1 family membrane protein insertase